MHWKKLLAVFLVLLLATPVFASIAIRDRYPQYYNRSEAFIHLEDGTENLFVMLDLQQFPESVPLGDNSNANQKTVWIFPVPAKPGEIEIDTLKGFPRLYGKDLKQQFTENLFLLDGYMAVAAFPPLGILVLLTTSIAYSTLGSSAPAARESGIPLDGITIYEHIDKFGIATEVIEANDAERFKRYLSARGTNLSEDSEKFLEEYMGRDYSFVVSWISDPNAAAGLSEYAAAKGELQLSPPTMPDYYYQPQNPVGVFIRFPAEKIYFPLKPMAYYGERQVPVTINVSGFKNADIFPNIKEQTQVSHRFVNFLSRTIQEQETLDALFNGNAPGALAYTQIQINAQANYFTQDLELDNEESLSPHALNAINQTWIVWMLLIFIGIGSVCAFVTNRLLKLNLTRTDFVIFALVNLLTILAVALAVALLKKEKFVSDPAKDALGKKVGAVLVFEALFFGAALLLFAITIGINAIR